MQSSTQSGWDNVAVNVDGDNNTVTISRGGVELTLFRRHLRPHQVESDLDLLHPEARAAIPLLGRAEDLARLRAWLDEPRPVAVRCVIGEGGSGKTRLAIELCELAEGTGWDAGFITFDELARFTAHHHLGSWRWRRPTLLVIDYAATAALAVREWLEQLARLAAAVPHERRLRLLLVERHASAAHGWWADLTRPGTSSTSGLRRFLDPGGEPVPLPQLRSTEDRRRLLERIMEAANGLRPDAPPVRPPGPGTDPAFERELADGARHNEPLYLMMAGLGAVQHRVPHLLGLNRADLARGRAEAEAERIRRLAEAHQVDPDFLVHMAALVTLADGLDLDGLTDAVAGEGQALGLAFPGGPRKVVKTLADGLPTPARGRVDAIRPDLIGEALVLHVLHVGQYTDTQQAALVERVWRRAPEKTLAAVIRTAQDYAGDEFGDPSLSWLDQLIDLAPDLAALVGLAGAMPEATLALRERAAIVQERIVEALRPVAGDVEEGRAYLATSLNNLANRLSALGRREEALAAAGEAAGLYRELAAARPDAFRPDLATSLSVLADRLEEVGRLPEAVRHDHESVATLAPAFLRYPEALAGPMLAYVRDYLRRAEAAGVEPDGELLGPIIGQLATMMGSEKEERE